MPRGRAWLRQRDQTSVLIAIVAAGVSLGAGPSSDPLVEEASGVILDWRRGLIVATGGAAADLRMPTADASRPGAERRARQAARSKIARALRALPLGGGRRLDDAAIARALGRARPIGIEYQSNGGALVQLEVAFGDWAEASANVPLAGGAPDPRQEVAVSLWLPEGQLAAAPLVLVGGRELTLGSARYLTTDTPPKGVRPLTVHADRKGRLLWDGVGNPPELAGRPALIYVRKILR
jgi:hypothetical protein